MTWTKRHDAWALTEGWAFFEADGRLEIERLDEPDEGCWGFEEPVWEYDDDVWQYLVDLALLGHPLAQDALAHALESNPHHFLQIMRTYVPPRIFKTHPRDFDADIKSERGEEYETVWEEQLINS